MSVELHATVRDHLRRSRQRYTAGRRGLVEMLVDIQRPVTIPELIEAGAGQSQSSLYRNLAVLEQCGIVRRLPSVNESSRYELDEHFTEHHHHLVCSQCGRVEDITLTATLEDDLEHAVERAGRSHGYALEDHRLELIGACPDCR